MFIPCYPGDGNKEDFGSFPTAHSESKSPKSDYSVSISLQLLHFLTLIWFYEDLKALKEAQSYAILSVCIQVATFIYEAPSH